MPHIFIRAKVADFNRWKAIYSANAGVRKIVGLKEEHLWRSAADPNNVFILFATDNLNAAQAYVNSPELRAKMKEAGVTDRPDIHILL
jgi:heme-degrading monooxygenase HmoA